MSNKPQLSNELLSIVTAVIAGSGLFTVSPVLAATFAASQTIVEIKNFSHQALGDAIVITDAQDLTIAESGEVNADSEALVYFANTPQTHLENLAWSQAKGEGKKYFGQGESTATVIGNFFVEENQFFSFDFSSYLNLKTAIDSPVYEKAKAAGNIFLGLYEIIDNSEQILLDSFFVYGNLETRGKHDFLDYEKTSNFIADEVERITSFGTTSELASIFLHGSFNNLFENNTYLSLVEIKSSYAIVKTVPEPSMTLGFLLLGFVATGIKIKSNHVS